jgi:hypothetical protein
MKNKTNPMLITFALIIVAIVLVALVLAIFVGVSIVFLWFLKLIGLTGLVC